MHRTRFAAWQFAAAWAVVLAIGTIGPDQAGAAGVYENASAEPAFLLSERRVHVRAEFDYSHGDAMDGTVYRLTAVFPLRNAFAVAIEQPFVAISSDSVVDSGIGDLVVRGSARLWRGDGRALTLLGYLGAGTGEVRLFPYSSQTFDVSMSLGYADSLGAVTLYALFGNTWVHQEKDGVPDDQRHTDYWKASGGVIAALGGGIALRAGILHEDYRTDANRNLCFGGVGFDAAPTLRIELAGQAEVGSESQRVSDWAASLGAVVRF